MELRIINLQKQLSVVNPIINSHIFWSEALGKVQNLIQPQVQVQTLNADMISNNLLLKGLASNYTILAKQIAALYTLDSVTDIVLNKVQTQPTGNLEFTLQIKFDTKKFLIKGPVSK